MLTVIVGLIMWNALATLPNIGTPKLQGPAPIDVRIIQKISAGCPESEGRYTLEADMEAKMMALSKRTLIRLDRSLCPPCQICLDNMPPIEVATLRIEDLNLRPEPEIPFAEYKQRVFIFCEGFNDYYHYIAGDYSVQQLVRYYQQLEYKSAYAAGINEAATLQGDQFPWDDPQYFMGV